MFAHFQMVQREITRWVFYPFGKACEVWAHTHLHKYSSAWLSWYAEEYFSASLHTGVHLMCVFVDGGVGGIYTSLWLPTGIIMKTKQTGHCWFSTTTSPSSPVILSLAHFCVCLWPASSSSGLPATSCGYPMFTWHVCTHAACKHSRCKQQCSRRCILADNAGLLWIRWL